LAYNLLTVLKNTTDRGNTEAVFTEILSKAKCTSKFLQDLFVEERRGGDIFENPDLSHICIFPN